jgi:peptide/nickel transport system permease protein
MTRIDAVERPPVPAAAKAGLVLPGLGHVLTGHYITGFGWLGVDAILLWAAIAGFPRIGEVTGLTGTTVSYHGLLANLLWFVFAGIAWWRAYLLVNPVELSEEERNSTRALFFREFQRNRNGMLGVTGATWLAVITVVAPMIAPFDPDAVGVGEVLLGPGGAHLMGTDEYGRDMFSRTLIGARVSMAIGFVAVSIAATIGTTVGAIAGWFGGRFDRLVMWFVDLLLALPRLVLLLAIVGLFRPKGVMAIFLIVTILGLTGWMGVSRIVRSQVLSLRKQDFIQAAMAMGMSDARIIFRHLIPNAIAPVIVYCSLAIGGTMLAEASLSFLGLGVQPPTATWGTLVADGRGKLQIAPWIAVFPGLAIVFAVMSFNLLGDGLRDALDPKQRSS